MISRDTVILEVTRGNVGRIIDVQALTVRFHRVAGEAKLSRFRMFDVNGGSENRCHDWKDEEGDERENLTSSRGGE